MGGACATQFGRVKNNKSGACLETSGSLFCFPRRFFWLILEGDHLVLELFIYLVGPVCRLCFWVLKHAVVVARLLDSAPEGGWSDILGYARPRVRQNNYEKELRVIPVNLKKFGHHNAFFPRNSSFCKISPNQAVIVFGLLKWVVLAPHNSVQSKTISRELA